MLIFMKGEISVLNYFTSVETQNNPYYVHKYLSLFAIIKININKFHPMYK